MRFEGAVLAALLMITTPARAASAVTMAPRPAVAQNTGTISGTVIDNTGQVVPGATVTLTNEATASARTTVSGDARRVRLPRRDAGSYTVRVELAGFRTIERRNNVLNASGQLDLGAFKLEVGTVTEVVSVVAEGSTVETKNSDYSGLLTSNQISQIQTRGRDVVNLLRLLPGVHYENDIDAMGDSFGSQMPNIGGQRRNWNQVTVDGLNGNELSGTNRMNSSINLDAIAEVKVLLNTYKAEFGHTGGANIEIVSKSGSADYHGSAYWYGRRDAWNASPWENKRAGLAKPKLHIDTPGFNLGGPVRIPGVCDRAPTRSCSSSTRSRRRRCRSPDRCASTGCRPRWSAGRLLADDRHQRALIFVKDPPSSLACSVTAGGAGCFPGNIIPANRLDSNGLALLNLLPLPNALGQSPNYNFSRQETADNPRLNNLLRVDTRPSSGSTIWATVRTFNSNQYGSEITAGPAKWGFFNGAYLSGDNAVNGGWNHVSSSSGVNEFQTGIRRRPKGSVPNDADLDRIRKATSATR